MNPRSTLLVALVAVAVVVPAVPVAAHVTVNPREAAAGSYAKLAFRVPNERDDTATTKLEIALPAEHPFSSVSVRPRFGLVGFVSAMAARRRRPPSAPPAA